MWGTCQESFLTAEYQSLKYYTLCSLSGNAGSGIYQCDLRAQGPLMATASHSRATVSFMLLNEKYKFIGSLSGLFDFPSSS